MPNLKLKDVYFLAPGMSVGYAECLVCGHKWKAAYFCVSYNKLECPECGGRLSELDECKN